MLDKFITFFKNRSLVFRLSISILLTVLVGIFILSEFISNYSKPLLKEKVVSTAYKELGKINYNIAQEADAAEQTIANAEEILELKKHLTDEELKLVTEAGLKSIRKQFDNFYEFFIYIPPKNELGNGIIYQSYLENGKINTVSWKDTGFAKDREWLKNVINSEDKPHWSEPYMSVKPDGHTLLSTTVAVPFEFKGDTSRKGIIATSASLDAMRNWLNNYKFKSNGMYLLTSAKGQYLIHPDKNIEFKKTISELAEEMNLKQIKHVENQTKEGKSGFVTLPKSSVYNGEVVFVYAPIPKTNWSSYLIYSSNEFYKPAKHFQIILLTVTIFLGIVLVILINWICKYTTNPIVKLSQIAEKYGKGEFETELPPVKSDDEIGILTLAFYSMRSNLLKLLKIQQDNAREEQKRASELEIATQIQSSVLPRNFPETTKFDIFASMTPAKEVGGDFYDFFYIDENRFAFLVADVSGKGIPAALFMMNSKSLLKSSLLGGGPLNTIINKVNNELCKTNDAGMFLTAFIAILNTQTGEMEYVNAGHNSPAVKIYDKFEFLKTDNNLVLSAIENFEYKSSKILLEPESNIFIYTDGVTEAQNTKKEFYGNQRLLDALNDENLNPEELIEKVKKDVKEFSETAPQFDDITVLSIKRLN